MLNEIFQFVAANNLSLKTILMENCAFKTSLVIDLEDALQNVLVPVETARLKENGRTNLVSVFKTLSLSTNASNIGIRINSHRSNEFYKDLELLSGMSSNMKWAFIVVPKIESEDEIFYYEDLFHKNNIHYGELIPVIETVKGLENGKHIFSHPAHAKFKRAFWGHLDYNLDAGFWPFLDHESEAYWQLTARFIKTLMDAGYGYINGPVTQFNNDLFVKKILARTANLCVTGFDQAALSFFQVEQFNLLRNSYTSAGGLKTVAFNNDKTELARETVQAFENFYADQVSFSINTTMQVFISPHQYLCAKNFLHKINTV